MHREAEQSRRHYEGDPHSATQPFTVKIVVPPSEEILRIQSMCQDMFPLVPKPPKTFHITLVYLGTLDELFKEVSAVAACDRDIYARWFDWLAHNLATFDSSAEHAIAQGLEVAVFGGSRKPILVLRVDLPDEVVVVREKMFVYIMDSLRDLGIEDPYSFAQTSPTFRYQYPTHNPHISLGKFEGITKEIVSVISNLEDMSKLVAGTSVPLGASNLTAP